MQSSLLFPFTTQFFAGIFDLKFDVNQIEDLKFFLLRNIGASNLSLHIWLAGIGVRIN